MKSFQYQNFKFSFLLIYLLLTLSGTAAFQSTFISRHPAAAAAAATRSTSRLLANFNSQNDVDISDVLAEIEGALTTVQEVLPSDDGVAEDMADISKMQLKMEELERTQNTVIEQQQQGGELVISAITNSAMDVVSGVGKAFEYAQERIEAEEDLSKVPEKVITAVQTKANEEYQDFRTGRTFHDFVTYLGSDEFKHASEEAKDMSGKAFNAIKAGLESDEMKTLQSKTVQAIKDGWESDERKALQSRASEVIKESLGSNKKS